MKENTVGYDHNAIIQITNTFNLFACFLNHCDFRGEEAYIKFLRIPPQSHAMLEGWLFVKGKKGKSVWMNQHPKNRIRWRIINKYHLLSLSLCKLEKKVQTREKERVDCQSRLLCEG